MTPQQQPQKLFPPQLRVGRKNLQVCCNGQRTIAILRSGLVSVAGKDDRGNLQLRENQTRNIYLQSLLGRQRRRRIIDKTLIKIVERG